MYICELFEELKAIHGPMSRNKFCRDYLGTDRNYMNVCVHQNTDISTRVLLNLIRSLRSRARQWAELAAAGSAGTELYQMRHRRYQHLSDRLMERLLESDQR
jgi:hypothetical protein